ncbi:MAG: helix-turn-helix transcriptional regulator [Eubacterium sp.]|nr:helix-turn-helix transcriptional regulator [Eubacterium sp.]
MNLEIANRLVALRKENNLSQEALAEKLGISRQAVSKWERAEASPDTDNLIALARLYHISLDELLKIHEEGMQDYSDTGDGMEDDMWNYSDTADDVKENVHIGFDGIHVKDKDGEVHVSWSGIHVRDKKEDNEVQIDKNGIRVNGEDVKGHIFTRDDDAHLPLGIIAIVVYIMIGAIYGVWHPGWLIFFLVPIISTLIYAIRKRNPNLFAYPVLAVLVFLYIGLVHSVWHPTWVVFLTIPVYYSIAGYLVRTFTKDADQGDT